MCRECGEAAFRRLDLHGHGWVTVQAGAGGARWSTLVLAAFSEYTKLRLRFAPQI